MTFNTSEGLGGMDTNSSVPFVKKRGKTVLGERVAVFRLPAIEQPLYRNTFCMTPGILKNTLSFDKTPKTSAACCCSWQCGTAAAASSHAGRGR